MSINNSNNTKTVLDRSIEILNNMRNTKLMFIATKEEIRRCQMNYHHHNESGFYNAKHSKAGSRSRYSIGQKPLAYLSRWR